MYLWGLLTVCMALVGESFQHGVTYPSGYPKEIMVALGVPENAMILAFIKVKGPLPGRKPISNAKTCKLLEWGKNCRNASATDPMYLGKDCSGSECYIEPYKDPGSCALGRLKPDVDMTNSTRKLTCGLDPEDQAVIDPTAPVLAPPGSESQKTVPGLPKGIQVHAWEACLKGRFQQVVRIQFPEPPADTYTCAAFANCTGLKLTSYGVCFTTGDLLGPSVNGETFYSGSLIVVLAISYFVLFLCFLQ